ncbi:MAG TPA: hypothetical protein VFS43_02885 [Polyangiaceae bacterium]|nr:hypothetical protein [Polyangiaceae bacterium]
MAVPYQASNLDEVVQSRMLRFGVAMSLVALGLSTILLETGASTFPRALLFVPFWLAAYGVLSSLFRTCAFAALGASRLASCGRQPIACREGVTAVRRRGFGVFLASVAVAALMTGLLLASPAGA